MNRDEFERQWLAGLPDSWEEKRADFLCDSYRVTVDPEIYGDDSVAHYSIPQVQATGGPAIEPASDIDSSKLLITDPTLLVSKLNPRKSTVCIAAPDAELPTLASGEFVAIRSSKIDQGYAYYLWSSAKVTDRLSAIVHSVTRSHQRVNPADITKLPWKWPPLETQRRIARFLDAKTARIDALIAKKRTLLERLAEKRQALITQAVTTGLDPSVPMKDSGIDWLGRIPAHWGMKRLRFVVRLASGATPSTTTPEYWEGDIPWISPKDVKRDLLRDSQDHVTHIAIDECGLRLFSQPDVVLVVRGMILARYVPIAVATGTYTINQDIKVLESKGEVEPAYLQMYLASINSYLMTLVAEAGHGTKALRTDVLLDSPVLLPSVDEQRRIVASMDDAKRYFDDAMTKLADSASTLVEYRAALITAAVTGQLEVPADAQHNRPDERLGKLAAEVA